MRSLVALVLAAAPLVAAALPDTAAPVLLYQQGRLLQSDDTPVDGARKLTVSLYASAEGGTAGWSETYDVTVTRGTYALALGDTRQGKKALTADDVGGDRWLGVTIDGSELLPRLRLGSVPHALTADVATSALDAQKLGGKLPADYALAAELPKYAALAGAAFTGPLSVPEPAADAHAATKKYVDDKAAQQTQALGALSAELPKYAALAGSTFTGAVNVPAPTADTSAATKKYVDDKAAQQTSALAGYALLAGATFAGQVNVPAPTADTSATTKKYVDDKVTSAVAAAGIGVTSTRPAGATAGKLIFNSASGGLELFDGTKWQVFGGSYPSCKAILDAGASQGDGVYTIRPDSTLPAFQTFCDMTTDGGGWTLVGSLVDQDAPRGADSYEQRWNRAGAGSTVWGDKTTFGQLGTATKSANGDYKNAAYFALTAHNLLVYHTPNDTAAEQLRSSALYAYYTTDGFLDLKGGSLYRLFKDFHPIVRGAGNTEAFRVSTTFAIGTANALWSESSPSNKAESEAGKMSFMRRNGEGWPFAFCINGYNGGNAEHSCVGGDGETGGRGYGGYGDFRDWYYDSNWGQTPKMRSAALLMLVR